MSEVAVTEYWASGLDDCGDSRGEVWMEGRGWCDKDDGVILEMLLVVVVVVVLVVGVCLFIQPLLLKSTPTSIYPTSPSLSSL